MITIYRCQKCGKWSHAQRKPKRHSRTIWWPYVEEWFDLNRPEEPVEVGSEFDGLKITEIQYDMETDTGAWFESGAMVECGPFDTYEAWVVA